MSNLLSVNDDAISIVSSQSQSKHRSKKRASISSVSPVIRDQWSHLSPEQIAFDPRSVAQSFLSTTTQQFQHIPIPYIVPSAAPPQLSQQSVKNNSDEEDDEKANEKSDINKSDLHKSQSHHPISPSQSNAVIDAKRLLVDSSPPVINESYDLPSSYNNVETSAASHLQSIINSLSSGPLIALPRNLPSLAFLDFYHRREHVLKHVLFMVQSRERRIIDSTINSQSSKEIAKRQPSLSPVSAALSSESSTSPLLRMSILSLFPIIQSLAAKDPMLLPHLLSTLLSMLQTMPLLSLQNEPADCIDAFRNLLLRMTVRSPESQHVNCGNAVTALVGLSLAVGKLAHVLNSVSTMLKLSALVSAEQGDVTLNIVPFIKQLHELIDDRRLPRLDSSSFMQSFQHASPSLSIMPQARVVADPHRSMSSSSPRPPTSSTGIPGVEIPFLGAIATDGSVLLVVNECGIQSIGSGYGGTVARLVYSENSSFHAQIYERARNVAHTSDSLSSIRSSASKDRLADKDAVVDDELRSGTLLYVGGRLFFASPNFEVLAGAMSNASAPAALPLTSALIVEIDQITLQPMHEISISPAIKQSLPLYASICTDGQLIYALYRQASVAKKSSRASATMSPNPTSTTTPLFSTPNAVDVFVLKDDMMIFQRSVNLDEKAQSSSTSSTDRSTLSTTSSSTSLSCPYMCYCTGEGGYLARVLLTSRGKHAYGSSQVSKYDLFSLETGQLVYRSTNGSVTASTNQGTAVTFDPVNNLIWQYQPTSFTLSAWKNVVIESKQVTKESELRSMLPAAEALCSAIQQLAESSVLTKQPEPLSESYSDIQHRTNSLRVTHPIPDVHVDSRMTSKLLIDTSPDTFHHINTILDLSLAFLNNRSDVPASKEDVARVTRILISVLTVLCANLDELDPPFDDRSSSSPSQSVLPAELAAHLRDRLLQLSAISFADEKSAEKVRQVTLNAIIAGLSHLFSSYLDLASLFKEPYLSHPQFIERLASYPAICLVLAQPNQVAEQLAATGIIPTLLQRCRDNSKEQLTQANSLTRSPILTPTMRVLVALQQSLLSRIDEPTIRPHVLNYLQLLVAACVHFMTDVNAKINAENSDHVRHVVRSSLVGVLLPEAVYCFAKRDLLARLDLSTLRTLIDSSHSTSMSSALIMLDSFLCAIDPRIDQPFLSSAVTPARRLVHTVESSHPYDNKRLHHVLSFPQCDFLILHFDPRSTIHRSDTLVLSNQAGDMKAPAICGPTLPRHPIVISGDSLVVTFSADSQLASSPDVDRLWGFRMVIHGIKLANLTQQSFELDLGNSVALANCRIIHALLFPSSSPVLVEEPHIRNLCNDELMAGGVQLRTADTQTRQDEFLTALMEDRSPAKEWYEFMLRKVSGRPPLSAAAKKAMAPVERHMLAVLLHHSDLVNGAWNVAQELLSPANGSSSAEFAVAHPDFAPLQQLFKQLWVTDAAYLTATRVEKRWLDLLSVSPSDVNQEIRALQINDLNNLCLAKMVPIDKNDPGITAQRLAKRLSVETNRPAPGADLWQMAYQTLAQLFLDRCRFLLSLRNPNASSPKLSMTSSGLVSPLASSNVTSPPTSPGLPRVYTDQLRRSSSVSSVSGESALSLSRVNSQSNKQLARTVLGRPTLEFQSPLKQVRTVAETQDSFQQWRQREKSSHSASISHPVIRQMRPSLQETRSCSIVHFLTAPIPHTEPQTLLAALDTRAQFAQARVEGLNALDHLLQKCLLDSERNALLFGLGEGIRKYWSNHDTQSATATSLASRTMHFSFGLNAVGADLLINLRHAWFKLVKTLVSILRSTSTHTSTKLLTLDVLGLHYSPDDAQSLADSGLFATLKTLLSGQSSLVISSASRTLFCRLAAICLWWQPSNAVHGSSLMNLQSELFVTVFDQVKQEFAKLAKENYVVHAASPPLATSSEFKEQEEKQHEPSQFDDVNHKIEIAANQVDAACYQLLTLVFQLRFSSAARSYLSRSVDALIALLSLSQSSTLRIQRLSLRLVRFILADSDIAAELVYTLRSSTQLPSISNSLSAVTPSNEASILSAMFTRIGELLTGANMATNFEVKVPARRLSLDPSQLIAGTAAAADKYNLVVLNTEVDAGSSSSSAFVNSVLSGLKDVIKSKSSKHELRAQLGSASGVNANVNSLTIMTGAKDDIIRVARLCSKRGFGVQVVPAPVQDGYLRNQKLAEYNPSAGASGEVMLSLVSELITLVRVLSASPMWVDHVAAALVTTLTSLDKCGENIRSSDKPAVSAAPFLAALSVLGGFSEPLRLGGRVRITSSDSEQASFGVLVSYARGLAQAEVVIEGETSPSVMPISLLTAVSSPFTAARLISSNDSVLASIISFLKTYHEQSEPASDDSPIAAERCRLTRQLALFALRAVCSILDDCPDVATRLASNASFLSVMTHMAMKSQPSSSLTQLEDQVLRAHERFLSLLAPAVYPLVHSSSSSTEQDSALALPHFPLASQAKRLPTAFSGEAARFLIFEDAHRRVCQYTKDASANIGAEFTISRSAGSSASAALRRIEEHLRSDANDEYLVLANAGVPVTLPSYYFEVELLTSNPISVGLSPQPRAVFGGIDAGIADLEQLSAANPSYARLHSMIKARLHNTWPEHSVRFSGRDGRCIRRLNQKDNGQDYSNGFGLKGDIIGCHWNLQDGEVMFTKNGQSLGPATTVLATATNNGQAIKYFPAIGFTQAGTRVRLNFGSEAFAYSLSTATSKVESEQERTERLTRASAAEALQREAEEAARVRAEVEKVARQAARDEMAQQLLDMCFGLLPSHRHALKALELHRDNASAAANFIFENETVAISEINRLIREEDAATRREDEKKEREQKDKADKEKREKAKQQEGKSTQSGSSPDKSAKDTSAQTSYDKDASLTTLLGTVYSRPVVDDGSDVDPIEEQWLTETETLLRSARLFPSENMLQAIMEQMRQGGDARANAILSLPISLPQPQRKNKDDEEPTLVVNVLKIEEAKPGMRVHVLSPPSKERHQPSSTTSPATSADTSATSSSSAAAVWFMPAMSTIVGHCGVITAVDSDSELCRVQFSDSETSSVSEWWLPIAHLEHAQTDSNAWIGWDKLNDVRGSEVVNSVATLAQLYARRVVLLILQRERKLETSPADILQLISAEMLPSLILDNVPSLPSAMIEVVDSALQSQPLLAVQLLEQTRTVLVQNTFQLDSNVGESGKEWDEDGERVVTKNSRALTVAFNASTRLPRAQDSITIYNGDLSATLKQWRGGDKTKATPLLPHVFDVAAMQIALKKEKATSKSTQVKLEVNGVPHTLPLAEFLVHRAIDQCIEQNSSTVDRVSSQTKNIPISILANSLLASMRSLSALLTVKSLSPLIKQSIFVLLTKCYDTIRSLNDRSLISAAATVDIHGERLYVEMLQLFEHSKKEGRIVLVSSYFQSLIELMCAMRHVIGEEKFADIGSDQSSRKDNKKAKTSKALLAPTKPSKAASNSSSSSSGQSSRTSRLTSLLDSPNSSASPPPSAAPQSSAAHSPASDSNFTTPRPSNYRQSETDRALREMMSSMSSLSNLQTPSTRVTLHPIQSSLSDALADQTSLITQPSSVTSSSPASTSATPARPSTSQGAGQSDDLVEQLAAMGFSTEDSQAALAHFGSFTQSLEALMSNWQPTSSPQSGSISVQNAHSPAGSIRSLSSLPSPRLNLFNSQEESSPAAEQSQSRVSSLSLESAAGSIESMAGDDFGDEERYHVASDEEIDDDDDEQALVRAISLSLQAQNNEEEKAREEKSNDPEHLSADPTPSRSPSLSAFTTPAKPSSPSLAEVEPLTAGPTIHEAPESLHEGPRAISEPWFDGYCFTASVIDLLYNGLPSLPLFIAVEAAIDESDRSKLIAEHSSWSLTADAELLDMANKLEDHRNIRFAAADKYQRSADIVGVLDERLCQATPQLRDRSLESIAVRMLLYRILNIKLIDCLSLIDLSRASSNDRTSLGSMLSFCRNLILSSVKFDWIDACLELTTREKATSKPLVVVDRQSATASMSKDGAQSVFNQCYRQLSPISVVAFKQPPMKGQSYTVIDIKFRNEHVVGEGGPYRQMFNDICRELQTQREQLNEDGVITSVLGLLQPSANQSINAGEQRDKFVPSPSATSSTQLAQFEFIGKLIGIALRTNVLMPLDLPSFFFKPLVNQQLTVNDLESIDSSFVNGVLSMLYVDDPNVFNAHFGDSLTWSTTLSDASTVDLKQNGAHLPVSFSDRHKYATLAEQARLNESRGQLKAVHRGLTEMVPESLLSLLTWNELERRVCGQPYIDIELLKRHTEYSGCSEKSPHVQYFWQALSDMSQEDRRKFIAFCSGSERLPSTDEDFNRGGAKVRLLIKEALTKKGENVDTRFLRSDTCFFNLELPAYSSLEVMKAQIQAVISMDVGMNADDDHTLTRSSNRQPSSRRQPQQHSLNAREMRATEAFQVSAAQMAAEEMDLEYDEEQEEFSESEDVDDGAGFDDDEQANEDEDEEFDEQQGGW